MLQELRLSCAAIDKVKKMMFLSFSIGLGLGSV